MPQTRIQSADEIKSAREKLGISSGEFAKILHLKGRHAGHTVRRWESGEAPIPAYVGIILDVALNVPGALVRLKQNQWISDDPNSQ